MASKCYVTGAAGFLGSNLLSKILQQNQFELVIGVDNLLSGFQTNIQEFLSNKKFKFETNNVRTMEFDNCDQIWNLACPASPPKYQADPLDTFFTSIEGVANVSKAAIKYNARLFHASTSEVYGDPKVSPQSEEYWGSVNPMGPRSCYDEGKRGGETLLFDYARMHGLDYRIARIFNTYGPKMSHEDGRVVSNLIVQALRGDDITIYGDGLQTRSFCYVDDLIDGLILLMGDNVEACSLVNVGNDKEYTVLELSEMVLRLTSSKSKVIFKPLPIDDPKQRRPSIAKAKKTLNWEPKVSLEDGLKETINYFQSQPDLLLP